MLAVGSPAARVPCRRPQSPHRYGTTARQAFGAKLNQKMRNHTSVSMFIIKRTQCASLFSQKLKLKLSTTLQQYHKHPISTTIPPTTEKTTKKQILLMKKAPHLWDLNEGRAAAAHRERCRPYSPRAQATATRALGLALRSSWPRASL